MDIYFWQHGERSLRTDEIRRMLDKLSSAKTYFWNFWRIKIVRQGVRFGVILGMSIFFYKNVDGVMERGDKILKNGILVISTSQKLTETLQIRNFLFLTHLCQKRAVGTW